MGRGAVASSVVQSIERVRVRRVAAGACIIKETARFKRGCNRKGVTNLKSWVVNYHGGT